MLKYFIWVIIPLVLIVPSSTFGEEIPSWIKNNAKWWSENQIDDNTFTDGIEFLIKEKIIKVDSNPSTSNTSTEIPSWIKNNAKWWSENQIDDNTFLRGIEYLIKNGIIKVEISHERKIETNLVSNYFKVWVYESDVYFENGVPVSRSFHFELKNDLEELYQDIGMFGENQNTVVIKPVFTSSAYKEKGFYDFYSGKCEECTTTKFSHEDELELSVGSQLGEKILKVLNYKIISDIDVDKDPEILKDFDKVILLHNEYVTPKEFDAITSHPNVIYLYPNALYAEVSVNYEENTITLIRGHNYPTLDISNGFGWEFDNSPMEYNEGCNDWEFYEISNGWMLNCYPEKIIASDIELLKSIKQLGN